MSFNKKNQEKLEEVKNRERFMFDAWATFQYEFLTRIYLATDPLNPEDLAVLSYEYAEEMLKERRKALARVGL